MKDFKFRANVGLFELYVKMRNSKKIAEQRKIIENLISYGNIYQTIEYYNSLIKYYKQENKTENLINLALKLYNYTTQINSNSSKSSSLKELIDAYKNKNDYVNSLKYLSILNDFKDSLDNTDFDEKAYTFNKDALLNIANKSVNDIKVKNNSEIQFQILIRNLTIFISIILITISFIIYKRYKKNN